MIMRRMRSCRTMTAGRNIRTGSIGPLKDLKTERLKICRTSFIIQHRPLSTKIGGEQKRH
jgi:hypothetical protein